MSGRPKPAPATPKPVIYRSFARARTAMRAESASNTPGTIVARGNCNILSSESSSGMCRIYSSAEFGNVGCAAAYSNGSTAAKQGDGNEQGQNSRRSRSGQGFREGKAG